MYEKIRPSVAVTKTIVDPLFGSLTYIISDANTSCKFDKKENICSFPFTEMNIQLNGDVYTCCKDWNPCSIGNIDDDDLITIWNSERAKMLRNSILDGSYRYCNVNTCPAMISGNKSRLITRNAADVLDYSRPSKIVLTIDSTCNLVCPSCRSEKLIEQSPIQNARARKILQSLMDTIFNEPHLDKIYLTMDGSGEIFFSPVYREFFENAKIFKTPELWPNLTIVLCTNGVMMTEKIQKKYVNMFDMSKYIRVSIDAGNKESYDKVRKGGDWDLLWKNLDYWYATRKNTSNWTWNVVLQQDNYESIPELIRLAYNYPENLPEIYIVNLLNWGVCSLEEFDKKAIWSPKSPEHQRLIDIMNLPEVKAYPKFFQHSVKT